MAEPALTPRRRSFDEPSPDPDDIDLRELVASLWRYRLFICGVTLACALLGLALGLSTKRMYEAEVALAVTQSKLGQGGTRTTTADFRPFVENAATAAQVIQELRLNEPPYQFSPTTFFDDVVTLEEVRNSTVMILRARIPDPKLAMNVVNRVAELASETASRVSQQEAVKVQSDLKLQLNEAGARLERAEGEYRTFRETSQIELLRRDLDALLAQRGRLLSLLVSIETERSRLAKAEGELAIRPRTDTFTRSIESEPAMIEAVRKPASQASDVMGLQLRNEQVNPVYQTLDQQIATTRTNLAALEQEKAQLVGVHKLNGDQLKQLTDLYQKESQLSRLEMERDLGRRVYLEVANSYETARLQVAGRSADLQLIAPALAPDRPISRRVATKTLIWMAAGLLLSTVGVLFYAAIAADRQTTNK